MTIKITNRKISSILITALFLCLISLSGYQLYRLSIGNEINHPLIGEYIPDLNYPVAVSTKDTPDFDNFKNSDTLKIMAFNASWCGMCKIEHHFIQTFAETLNSKQISLAMIGLRDNNRTIQTWLQENGNPYNLAISDLSGEISTQWQINGVPMLFVISQNNKICKVYQGVITSTQLNEHLSTWQEQCTNI